MWIVAIKTNRCKAKLIMKDALLWNKFNAVTISQSSVNLEQFTMFSLMFFCRMWPSNVSNIRGICKFLRLSCKGMKHHHRRLIYFCKPFTQLWYNLSRDRNSSLFFSKFIFREITLEFQINVPPLINVPPGQYGKNK